MQFNSHDGVYLTPEGVVTIFGVLITPKGSYMFQEWSFIVRDITTPKGS